VLIVFIKNIAIYDAYSLGFLTKDINKYFTYCTWISNAITKSDERKIFKENNVFINNVFFVLFLFLSRGAYVSISLYKIKCDGKGSLL
jgi:hypothetical protein